MRYDYRCNKCDHVWEVSHGLDEKPKIKCPECGSKSTEIAITTAPTTYVKGYGWLDKKGRNRDMNLHKLQNDDPYGNMRQPGEKEDLEKKLKSGGKFNPKKKTFTARTTKKKAKKK